MSGEAVYSCRAFLWTRERTYRVANGTLAVDEGASIPLSAIRKIRSYRNPGLLAGMFGPPTARCVAHAAHGGAIAFGNVHCLGFGKFEDRTRSYDAFVTALVSAVAAANPRAVFVSGMPLARWFFWVTIIGLATLMAPLMVLLSIVMIADGQYDGLGAMSMVTMFLVVVALSSLRLFRELKRSWPRHYDPRVQPAS